MDDENDETTTAIADGLKVGGLLEIELEEPKDFKTQRSSFEEHLKNYDGIILDLRLDGKRLDIPYNAPALAQELRMMAVEGLIKSCPIILCSTEEKMKATYEVDKTSHDLFDYKFHKQASPPWQKFARKMSALAKGYLFIEECKFDMKKILGREDLNALDSRVLERFYGLEKPAPVSEYAMFVIKDLFHHPGVLIKETLLAARLGIDISKSEDWPRLLNEFFKSASFVGVFSHGWTRWWADMIVDIFKTKSGKRLSMLNASQRVDALIEMTGLKNLVAAQTLPYAKSNNFWTICEYYKMPLDPLEGFIIHSSIEPKSWQENRYISLDAVLNKRGPRPHSSEAARIELIKESLKEK
ncbi:MAG: hypothetical protein ACTHK8_08445 [Ginsengibacter sp.]